MPVASYLSARAQELLTAAQAALTLARTGNAVPARVYRSHGPPAVDWCNQDLLVVYLDNPAEKLSNPAQGRAAQVSPGEYLQMPIARFVVELWRCVPTIDSQGTPPTATALDTSASGLQIDIHALVTGLRLAQTGGTLFPGAGLGCGDPMFGDPVPLVPQGAMAGWRIRVEYPMNDAGPSL